MEILSISMDDESLKRLNEVQKRLGFKSRSKMLRSAVLSMIKDYDVIDSLKGNVKTIFVLTYNEHEKNNVSDLLHKYEDAIKTELHQHTSGTCIDVLNIQTDAKRVKEIFSNLKRDKSIYSVTYMVIRKSAKG